MIGWNMKYFYGESYDEVYDFTDPEECADYIASDITKDDEVREMIEMKPYRSEDGWCLENKFVLGIDSCGKYNCDDYIPRNGKNGICKHHSFCLKETGRKWNVYGDGSFKKTSERKK